MKYITFITFICLEAVLLSGLVFWGMAQEHRAEERTLPKQIEVTRRLMLTDLSVWSEARYTRHPSQADLFTPFQDFPSAVEHFPAGSILTPVQPQQRTKIEVLPPEGAAVRYHD